MKLAIFGGTFDPIHNAHLMVAREAIGKFSLDRVLMVPAANPPHKQEQTPADYEDRYRMVALACGDDPRLQSSRLEEGGSKSYSYYTIGRVKETLGPNDTLYFLIGADAFAEIGSWFHARKVIEMVRFIVVARPGHVWNNPPGACVERLDTLALPVSSSEIRRQLAAGREPPELPPAVMRFIRERGLYGFPTANR
ncbi:MAG: nicotinate (nicotinamide) nucleotide adenylyltransferase [Bryobacterales bacterium]|nr:nicotinate (nicotinamide) nucleotide adenylyltransferase [Bryobacterales bacterium]